MAAHAARKEVEIPNDLPIHVNNNRIRAIIAPEKDQCQDWVKNSGIWKEELVTSIGKALKKYRNCFSKSEQKNPFDSTFLAICLTYYQKGKHFTK